MGDADLHDFIACYNLENRHERKETWSEDKFWTYVGITMLLWVFVITAKNDD